MPRPRIYANNSEKMKAYRLNKKGTPFKVVNGEVVRTFTDILPPINYRLKSNVKVTNSNVTNQKIKDPAKMMDRVHKATHTELILTTLKTAKNRGISNDRLYALAEFVVDQIYKDCRGY